MKHELKITAVLLGMFIATQLIGLFVIDAYSPKIITLSTGENITGGNNIPYGMQPPSEMQTNISLATILISLAIAVTLMLLLMKFKARIMIRTWFMLVIFITLAVAINGILLNLFPGSNIRFDTMALLIAMPLTFYKVFKRNLLIHNITELFIYPGLAVMFIPILNITAVIILLIVISIYDFIAVIKSKFMVQMAKYQIKTVGIFSGFFVPYLTAKSKSMLEKLKVRNSSINLRESRAAKKIPVSVAILGGGDIAFALIFAGVIMRNLGLIPALIVIACSSLCLLSLFFIGKKGKFYPAMPFVTAGCILGWLISKAII